MPRRTDFRKAISYTGQKVKGDVHVSYKIDGCRVLYRYPNFVSRNNKPFPGLATALTDSAKSKIRRYGDCEIFHNSFKETDSLLQRHHPDANVITESDIYPLDSEGEFSTHFAGTLLGLDSRLNVGTIENPSPAIIESYLQKALELGYEGLVLRTSDRWYRVKPQATADVYIRGWFEQMDKHKNPKGVLGGFETDYGKVTAFTDSLRKELWENPDQYIGQLMEVQYKELYDTGSFRYCVKFLRFRRDKDEESFDIT